MRVKCVRSNLEEFSSKAVIDRLRVDISDEDGESQVVEKGKIYTVYALSFSENVPVYYICFFRDANFPFPVFFDFFDILDPRPSRYWQWYNVTYESTGVSPQLVYEEWGKDPLYYEHLLDGQQPEKRIFLKYKALMDVEFPDPELAMEAHTIEGEPEWVMCPNCCDAWQPGRVFAITKCKNCWTTMNNPLWEDPCALGLSHFSDLKLD